LETAPQKTLSRNDPCHCGSGKKYKQCHLDQDEAAAREARAKVAATAAAAAPEAEPAATEAAGPSAGAKGARPKLPTGQPWKRGGAAANTRGFQRTATTRKTGGGG
jgi:SEC-C motif